QVSHTGFTLLHSSITRLGCSRYHILDSLCSTALSLDPGAAGIAYRIHSAPQLCHRIRVQQVSHTGFTLLHSS
ncbi:Hypothetical predicted protein, partial [Pelobates cultripes]